MPNNLILLPFAGIPIIIFGTLLWQSIKYPEAFIPLTPFFPMIGLESLMEEQNIKYSVYNHNKYCTKGIGTLL